MEESGGRDAMKEDVDEGRSKLKSHLIVLFLRLFLYQLPHCLCLKEEDIE